MIMQIDKLINPITMENPTGSDLRLDQSPNSIYYKIKDARQAARLAERNHMELTSDDNGMSYWENVYELAQDILMNTSKDLEIVAWFIEALLRKDGIRGLDSGLLLAIQLIESYWDKIFPLPDEEGDEIRVMALIGLNGQESPGSLIIPLTHIMITDSTSTENYQLWQYKKALDIFHSNDPNKHEEKYSALGLYLHDIKNAENSTTEDFYHQLQIHLDSALMHVHQLDESINAKSNVYVPFTNIKNALIDIQDHLRFLIVDKPISVTQDRDGMESEDNKLQTENKNTHESNTLIHDTQLISRDNALQTLERIADYFIQAEPHSPIPFLLKRACYWGSLNFPELLRELINDNEPLQKVYKLTGIEITEGEK